MSAKKAVVEVHKFGGASLADAAAYRHAAAIVKGRGDRLRSWWSRRPPGVTDALLGAGDPGGGGRHGGAGGREVEALRKRYREILAAAAGGTARSADGRTRPPRSTARSTSSGACSPAWSRSRS